MKLENEFTVPAPLDQAWAVLLDVERVAPCLPGAQVEPGADETGEYAGTMTIKIGPITSRYKGTVKIEQADVAARVAVMRAQAKDARGQGTAAATITSTMEPVAGGTRVKVETDMRVTGPAAQFGRGVMQDVSAKLMRQFAECLASEMSAAPAPAAAEPEPEPAPWSSAATAEPAEPAAPETPAEPALTAAPETPAEPALTAAPETPAEPALTAAPETPAEPALTAAPETPVEPVAPPEAATATQPEPAASAPPPPPRPTPEVLDLGAASRGAVLKRAVPLVGGLVALLIVIRLIRRR